MMVVIQLILISWGISDRSCRPTDSGINMVRTDTSLLRSNAMKYLRARYYQPEKGRFLTRDTYTGEDDEPLSLHLYTYCGNDGVNAWDPSGHKKKTKVTKATKTIKR